MSQYRLLIADDEEIARKALRLLIAKELPEVELLQDAANGIELVALVQELQPDIAIVDVNMPGMSGIEAVDLLCARGCKTRFIIHTAYDEFAYVQKALVLKVDAYLLKPSKREVTVDTIRHLCNQISQAKALQQSRSQMRELFARISPIMESEILYSLFIGEPATASFDSYCEIYNIRFTGGVVATVVPFGKGVTPPWQKERAQLRQVLDGALGGNCQYLTAVTESNLCLLLLLPEDVPAEQRPTWLEDVLHVTVDRLARQYSLPLRVGVGCISDTFSDMERSYRESCMALLDTQTAGIYFYLGQEQPRPLVGLLSWCREICPRLPWCWKTSMAAEPKHRPCGKKSAAIQPGILPTGPGWTAGGRTSPPNWQLPPGDGTIFSVRVPMLWLRW